LGHPKTIPQRNRHRTSRRKKGGFSPLDAANLLMRLTSSPEYFGQPTGYRKHEFEERMKVIALHSVPCSEPFSFES